MQSSLLLPELIFKASWREANDNVILNPDLARIPVPTKTVEKVFPIHLVICKRFSRRDPTLCELLKTLIEANPNALDYRAFLWACDNEETKIDIMETLFVKVKEKTLQRVKQNANELVTVALKCDNPDIAIFLMERLYIKRIEDILYQACKNGLTEVMKRILASTLHNKERSIAVLLKKCKKENESVLGVACRLFKVDDELRVRALEICVQHASQSRSELGNDDPNQNYPFVVAAIGWCPLQTYTKILHMHILKEPVATVNMVKAQAIQKAMHLAYEESDFENVPEVFKSEELIKACENASSEEVQTILEKDNTKRARNEPEMYVSRKSGTNALDKAIEMYNENDTDRSRSVTTLSYLLQYLNAKNMGLDFPVSSNYPVLFAAIGFVPKRILLSLFDKFKDEIETNDVGKAAIRKILWLGFKQGMKSMFATPPINVRARKSSKAGPTLETIHEAPAA